MPPFQDVQKDNIFGCNKTIKNSRDFNEVIQLASYAVIITRWKKESIWWPYNNNLSLCLELFTNRLVQ